MEKSIKTFIKLPFLLLLRCYKLLLSPFLVGGCRFQPTCSEYAADAIRINGVFKGSFQTLWRVIRCNPWGGSGYDPVDKSIKDIKKDKTKDTNESIKEHCERHNCSKI